MNKRYMIISAALSVMGMGALLAGCGDSAGSATTSEAQQQFLAERGSGTPGVVTDTIALDDGSGAGPGFGAGGAFGGGVFGTIDKVEGDKIYVNNPIAGNTSTVKLADGAKVYKQAEIATSDIKVGDAILAAGTRNGDALDATVVQVGQAGSEANLNLGGGRIFAGGPGGQGGQGRAFPQITPGARRTPGVARTPGTGGGRFPQGTPGVSGTPGLPGGPGNRTQGTPVIGTVEKVDGSTITIKPVTQGDPTVIRLGADVRVQKQTEMVLSDLQAGNTVTATGEQKGDVFEATRVQVIDAARMQIQVP